MSHWNDNFAAVLIPALVDYAPLEYQCWGEQQIHAKVSSQLWTLHEHQTLNAIRLDEHRLYLQMGQKIVGSYNGPIQHEILWKYFGPNFLENRVYPKLTHLPSFRELVVSQHIFWSHMWEGWRLADCISPFSEKAGRCTPLTPCQRPPSQPAPPRRRPWRPPRRKSGGWCFSSPTTATYDTLNWEREFFSFGCKIGTDRLGVKIVGNTLVCLMSSLLMSSKVGEEESLPLHLL